MFKTTALIFVASLAAAAADIAWAEPEAPANFVAPVVAVAEVENLLPLASSADGLVQTIEVRGVSAKDKSRVAGGFTQTQGRVRKEYPNVMGMSLTTWIKSRPL
jgi:hypothetical protein